MPMLGTGSRAAQRASAMTGALVIVAGALLAASAAADNPAPENARPQRVILHQQVIIQPDIDARWIGQEEMQIILQQVMDDEDAIMNIMQQHDGFGARRPNDQGIWTNQGAAHRRGLGLSQFNRLDRISRENLTAERVLALLGWSGMAATEDDPPLQIDDWSDQRILDGLNDPDSTTRRRLTRALALSDRFDEAELFALLKAKDLTLEQRSRLLDVSFARFVVAPRAAVGAQFQTGVPIQITGLFQAFPAAQANILRPTDELVEIEGHSLLHANAFSTVRAVVLSRQPGETVNLVVRRPFEPEVVAQILREREETRQARLEAARERMAEARAEAQEQRDPWEDDPVWQNIIRQLVVLEAKHPEGNQEITPEGDFMFAGQRLGNIAHLDGRRRGANPRFEPDPVELEERLTPGENLTIEVPLGNLADLPGATNANSPGVADLHNAWKHRLSAMGIDLAAVTAESISIRTPQLGWIESNVGQRVTTIISAPRSARQDQETSVAAQFAQRGNQARGVAWQPSRVAHQIPTPNHGRIGRDSTTFRHHGIDLNESEMQMRRHMAMNDAVARLSELHQRRATVTKLIQSRPAGAVAEALQAELGDIDRNITRIQRELGLTNRGE